MKKIILSIAILTFVTGCAVTKELTATGGSKSDGTIKLSYEYTPYEAPKVDKEQGLKVALQRCKAWGYKGAEAFGGSTKVCNQPAGLGGCNRWLVTTEYQCLSK